LVENEIGAAAPTPPASKRKKVISRTEAKKRFNDSELSLIYRFAPRMIHSLRVSARASDGSYLPGFETTPVPEFVSQTIEVLVTTACHISSLPELKPAAISDGAEHGFPGRLILDWVRPKNKAIVHVPLPESLEPWIRSYLALEKPKTEVAYFQIFRRLSDIIFEETGTRIHINPLRFRHTGIFGLKHTYNLTDRETAVMAGTTIRTVQIYASEDSDRVIERIFARGYKTAFGVPSVDPKAAPVRPDLSALI
jgi:hypothetical protein